MMKLLPEKGMTVFIRQYKLLIVHEGPCNCQRRIRPVERRLQIGNIIVSTFIQHMGPFALYIEAVGKPGRDPQPPVFRRELHANPLTLSRTPHAHIDRHIEDGAGDHFYQLALRFELSGQQV